MLIHPDSRSRANVVDITKKAMTSRGAAAEAVVRIHPEILQLIQGGDHPKGDVSVMARIAGIQAAKRTHELIPLCHPLLLANVRLELQAEAPDAVRIHVCCRLVGQTGVEMEAFTATSIATLTIYDMRKAVGHRTVIEQIQLPGKLGGKDGHYRKEKGGQT